MVWSLAETGILVFVVSGLIEVVLYFYIIQNTGGVLVSFSFFISLFAGIAWGMVIFGEGHGIIVWSAVGILLGSLGLLCFDTFKGKGETSLG